MDDQRLDDVLRTFLALRGQSATGATDMRRLADGVRSRLDRDHAHGRTWLPGAAAAALLVTTIAAAIVIRVAPETGSPTVATPVRAMTPWRLSLDASSCVTRPEPPPGPLPDTRPSTAGTVSDGLLAVSGAFSTRLVDPVGGSSSRPILLGPRMDHATWPTWSPDGRTLLVLTPTPGCGPVLISADGTRAVVVPTVTGHEVGLLDRSWSPDGRWLAVVDQGAVDVLRIEPDLRISEARRVRQASEDEPAWSVMWGSDGTLAIGAGMHLEMMDPGEQEPSVYMGDPCESPPAWAGARLACIGRSVGKGRQLAFIDREGDTTRIPLDLDLAPRGAKYDDIAVAVAAGRIYFTAKGSDGWIDIYSTSFDGADLRKVTTTGDGLLSPDLIAPSPDGGSVAYTTHAYDDPWVAPGQTPGLWLVDLASGQRRRIGDDPGALDWQAVPVP